MSTRAVLADAKIDPIALAAIASFHAEVVNEVDAAVRKSPVVVVGMAQNPFVKKARKALESAGIAFEYLEYGSYLSDWKKRLAIKMWSGWPTFPQVFVNGALIGGFRDMEKRLGDGSLQKAL